MRIVIAEDDALLREGLTHLVRAEGIEVTSAVSNPTDLLAAIEADRPDVAVVDVRMPPTHRDEGLRAAVEARERMPGLAVLVLSAHVDEGYAGELLASGQGGIGYLLKERVGRVADFLDALARVAAGGTAFDPEVVARLVARRDGDSLIDRLTPRERDVLALMAEGHSNATIAKLLVVSDSAVHKHIGSIFAKLDLPASDTGHRRVQAVLAYLAHQPGHAVSHRAGRL